MIFLGIDCGTQSTKTIALDWESGEILASAQKTYGFVPNPPAGAMEQDPKDWIDAAEQSIGEVIAKLGALKERFSVSVSVASNTVLSFSTRRTGWSVQQSCGTTQRLAPSAIKSRIISAGLPASSRSSGTRCAQAIPLQRSCGCAKTSPRIGRGHAASCFLMIT